MEDKYEVPYDIAKLMMPSILFYKMFMSKDKNKIIIAPEISLVDGILVEYVEKMLIRIQSTYLQMILYQVQNIMQANMM